MAEVSQGLLRRRSSRYLQAGDRAGRRRRGCDTRASGPALGIGQVHERISPRQQEARGRQHRRREKRNCGVRRSPVFPPVTRGSTCYGGIMAVGLIRVSTEQLIEGQVRARCLQCTSSSTLEDCPGSI